jgi:putative ABC transport system permease protein
MSFFRDLRIAVRSLARVPALWITVSFVLHIGDQ